jgi:uncharacterized RDD family membrane protein YckC
VGCWEYEEHSDERRTGQELRHVLAYGPLDGLLSLSEPLDTDVTLEAPEHIVFRYRVAGPARRALAAVFDVVVCYGTVLIVSALVVIAFAGFAGFKGVFDSALDAGIGIILVVVFAAQWLYSFLWEGLTGRSPGKMVADLRVVMLDGRPIGFTAAALRNVLRAADVLPVGYLVGVVAMAANRRFQRLGDLVAGTMVIIPGRAEKAVPLALYPPASPVELEALPGLVPLDTDERSAIELFLRRRATLGPAREAELAGLLMPPLEKRFGFRLPDASRTLALLYDRAANLGRGEAPPSSRWPGVRDERQR